MNETKLTFNVNEAAALLGWSRAIRGLLRTTGGCPR